MMLKCMLLCFLLSVAYIKHYFCFQFWVGFACKTTFGGCICKTQFKSMYNNNRNSTHDAKHHMRKLCATLNSKPHEATPTTSSQYEQRQVMDQNGELQANVTKYFSAAALRFKYPKCSRVKGNHLPVKQRTLLLCIRCCVLAVNALMDVFSC